MQKIQTFHRLLIYAVSLLISLSSLVMGYFLVYFTQLDQYIQIYHGYSNEDLQIYFTLTYALLPIGAFLSSFFYDFFVNVYGQNKMFRYIDYLAIIAISMQIFTVYTPVLCVSRFLMGIYCGFTTGLVPSYLLSLSPSFKSGIIGTLNQLAIVTGMAFAFYMGQFLQSSNFSDETSLRIYIGLPIICIMVHIAGLFLFPFDNIERHIYKRQNMTVRKYLKTVYGPNWKTFEGQIRQHKMIPIQVVTFQDAPLDEDNQDAQKQAKCKQINNSIVMAVMLAFANQISGINAIQQYAKQLFMVVQDDDQVRADFSVLMLGTFQIVVTLISGFLINRFGRRPLMLIGHSLVVLSLICAFMSTYLFEDHERITVILIFIHVLGYSMSLGPLLMLYAVEALPSLQLVIIVYWGLVAIITLISDFLIQSVGVSIMFLIFGVGSLFSFVFFFLKMVQSKGTSKKQVRELIQGTKIDWQKSAIIYNNSTISKDHKIQKSLEQV